MGSAADELDDIDRIHDEAPQAAAARLRALDLSQLPDDKLALAAFLFNHVLGEKSGAWAEAAQRIEMLRLQRRDVPLAVTIHAAVADELAARRDSTAKMALVATTSEAVADLAIALRRLSFTQDSMDAAGFAATLRQLARQASALDAPTALDAQLAAGLNNATSRLLDLKVDPDDAVTREALTDGAAQALRLWQRAGTWVNHERALYLVAVVANRLHRFSAARDAAEQAVALIDGHGEEEVDRAFILLHLARALDGLGETQAGSAARRKSQDIVAPWTDRALRDWYAQEQAKLFDTVAQTTQA